MYVYIYISRAARPSRPGHTHPRPLSERPGPYGPNSVGPRRGDAPDQKITYFTRKTTYSNRKFDIIDPNKWLILYLFLIGPFIYIEYSILYHKYIILYRIYSILTSRYQVFFLKNQPSNMGCYF